MLRLGPLEVNLWTFLFTVLNVSAVMWLLSRFLFKPVSEILERRERSVQETLASAQRRQEEAEQLLRDYQGKLADADARAQAILNKAARDAERLREERRQAAEAEAESLLSRARKEIDEEKEKAIRELRQEAVDLAIRTASRLLSREITAQDDHKFVEEFVSALAETGGETAPAGQTVGATAAGSRAESRGDSSVKRGREA